PHPRRTHQPLQCSRHPRDRPRGLNLKGKGEVTPQAAFLQQCPLDSSDEYLTGFEQQNPIERFARNYVMILVYDQMGADRLDVDHWCI
ncbi:hypothetical protein, partial [Rhodovulum sulfidophilum]|uniref:hypothetical protein n=1 Tax=Rhodovulum sulfidophilum TaxID=35806 RepID=UPI001F186888